MSSPLQVESYLSVRPPSLRCPRLDHPALIVTGNMIVSASPWQSEPRFHIVLPDDEVQQQSNSTRSLDFSRDYHNVDIEDGVTASVSLRAAATSSQHESRIVLDSLVFSRSDAECSNNLRSEGSASIGRRRRVLSRSESEVETARSLAQEFRPGSSCEIQTCRMFLFRYAPALSFYARAI